MHVEGAGPTIHTGSSGEPLLDGTAEVPEVVAAASGAGQPVRLLPLQGSYNFRDLGGYPTVDGRSTRWGRIFRSDALHELTPVDQAHLDRLGLVTVVDLRGPEEAERVGRWPVAHADLRYVNLPVIPPGARDDPTVPAARRETRAQRYLWYLEAGGEDAVLRAVELIADAENLPLVFHCAAGKDRTGIVAAVTLAAVGVTREAIVADYTATAVAMERILDRLRQHPVYRAGVEAIPPEDHHPDGEVMDLFLDGLEERYGGAQRWLRDAGMAPDAIDRLRHLLLD